MIANWTRGVNEREESRMNPEESVSVPGLAMKWDE